MDALSSEQTNIEQEKEDAEEAISSDDEEVEIKKQINRFQLLELESDEVDHDENSDQSNVNESEDETNISNCTKKSSNTMSEPKSKTQTKASRKNKKKKKKNHSIQQNLDFETEFSRTQTAGQPSGNQIHSEIAIKINLLKFDPRDLLPEKELTRMFGKSVVKADHANQARLPKNMRIKNSYSNTSRFVTLAENDMRLTYGVGPIMEEDEYFIAEVKNKVGDKKSSKNKPDLKSQDVQYFKFVHNKTYQEATSKFLDTVERGYSEGIIFNATYYPNHVESLLQLSDMLQLSEDYKGASETVEKALLILERGFHSKFNVRLCNCRLSYRRPENRTFFICLFKHIHYLARRGLKKTPLTYTKFLLSLDPDNDPLFALLLIDLYSIRSNEFDYLINFSKSWPHATKYPNFNFSVALAYFFKSKDTKEGKASNESDLKTSNIKLQEALMKFPNFIIPLLDICSGEPSAELKKCDYFDYSVYSQKKDVPECVDLLVRLYVARTYALWKTRDTLDWLEENITVLVNKFASGEIQDKKQFQRHWNLLRGPAPKQLLRHIAISGLPTDVIGIPANSTNRPVMSINPFPPNEPIISYTRIEQTPNPDSDMSLYGLIYRSIFPGFQQDSNEDIRRLSREEEEIMLTALEALPEDESELSNIEELQRRYIASVRAVSNEYANIAGDRPDRTRDSNFQANLIDTQSSIARVMDIVSNIISTNRSANDERHTQDGNNRDDTDNNNQESNP